MHELVVSLPKEKTNFVSPFKSNQVACQRVSIPVKKSE
jgi:hypothetical protein